MSSSINSVSTSLGSTSSNSSSSTAAKLSESTKAKLKELGLDPTQYSSEAEAQAAISQAQAQQQTQKNAHAGKNGSEDSIKAEATSLAGKLGVNVEDKESTDEILSDVSAAITNLKETAGTDESKKAEIEEYEAEYDAISQNLTNMQTSQAQLSASMNGMATYNKAYQKLS